MEKTKILKVVIDDEMPLESSIVLYRFIEKVLLDHLPEYPMCKGLFLSKSLTEFDNHDYLEVRSNDENT